MQPNKILAFDLTPERVYNWDRELYEWKSRFSFANIDDLTPDMIPSTIKCLSYRKKLGNDVELLRNHIYDTLQKRLDGKTLSDLERELEENQENLRKCRLRYRLNPFARDKKRDERGLSAMYYLPLVGVPIGFFDPTLGLISGVSMASCSTLMAEIDRRSDRWKYKHQIEEIERRLKDPKTKLYCDLVKITKKLEVETVFVEDANRLVEKFRDLEFLATDHEGVLEKVDERLEEIYYNFLESPSSL